MTNFFWGGNRWKGKANRDKYTWGRMQKKQHNLLYIHMKFTSCLSSFTLQPKITRLDKLYKSKVQVQKEWASCTECILSGLKLHPGAPSKAASQWEKPQQLGTHSVKQRGALANPVLRERTEAKASLETVRLNSSRPGRFLTNTLFHLHWVSNLTT